VQQRKKKTHPIRDDTVVSGRVTGRGPFAEAVEWRKSIT